MITQEGVHNILVDAMDPMRKVELSSACNNDPEIIKSVEKRMADILNVVVDIAVNPGTIYMNTKVGVPKENTRKVKLKKLNEYLEERIGNVPAVNLSVEALLSIIYSNNISGSGPSILSVLADYAEYLEKFLSKPNQQEDEDSWSDDYKEDEL